MILLLNMHQTACNYNDKTFQELELAQILQTISLISVLTRTHHMCPTVWRFIEEFTNEQLSANRTQDKSTNRGYRGVREKLQREITNETGMEV